jgi:hypothetical protein
MNPVLVLGLQIYLQGGLDVHIVVLASEFLQPQTIRAVGPWLL